MNPAQEKPKLFLAQLTPSFGTAANIVMLLLFNQIELNLAAETQSPSPLYTRKIVDLQTCLFSSILVP
jgi:hypothetical protein